MTVDPADRQVRWAAPRDDQQWLLQPDLARAIMLLQGARETAAAAESSSGAFHGWELSKLRLQARQEVAAAAVHWTRQYRDVDASQATGAIVMAGHQPTLFHPGVWFKNAVLSELGKLSGAMPINLVIDNDTLRSPSLFVPGGSASSPTRRVMEFDRPGAEVPFEQREIHDWETLESFADRACAEIAPLVPNPLVRRLWPAIVEQARATGRLGAAISRGRHRHESEWGWQTWEVPQSVVCDLDSFHRFVARLLAELPRFCEVYNAEILTYRRTYRVRSAHHPAPRLLVEADRVEAPFWVWRDDDPRRRRLFLCRRPVGWELSDGAGWTMPLPLLPDGDMTKTAEALAAARRQGVKIRTRALTTTLWARLMLSDTFIHGIGGAKYDEVTDRLMARWFGVKAPTMVVATATVRLPLARQSVALKSAREIARELRELTFHPERYLPEMSLINSQVLPGSAAWTKRRAIEAHAAAADRQPTHRVIERANLELQPFVAARRAALENERAVALQRLAAESILGSREFSGCLFPQEFLSRFYLAFAHGSCNLSAIDGSASQEGSSRNERDHFTKESGL